MMPGLLVTFKDYAHQVAMAVGLFLIFEMGQVVTWKLAKGQPFPENYDTYIWALIMLAGVNVAGMGVLRSTSPKLAAVKAAGKAAGPPQVNVAGDATVQTEAPGAVPAKPGVPRAGEALPAQQSGGAADDGAVG